MGPKHLIRHLLSTVLLSVYCFQTVFAEESAYAILQRSLDQINHSKNFQYNYKRELNYKSENYSHKYLSTVYMENFSNSSAINVRYQIEDTESKLIHNGSEKFELYLKDKTYALNLKPERKEFEHLTPIFNSVYTLKNAIPKILNAGLPISISDTVISAKSYFNIKTALKNNVINGDGSIMPITAARTNYYTIIIDKKSFFPYQVITSTDVNNDFTKTTFEGLRTNIEKPSEKSWYFSHYTGFNPKRQEKIKILEVGQQAPLFSLQSIDGHSFDLKEHLGKIIVLEFWYRNCGYCIAAVPSLNTLQQEFKGKGFELFSINMNDNKDDIDLFVSTHEVKFPVLTNGITIAKEYGIDRYPIAIIIGKSGNIIYNGEADHRKMETILNKEITQL